MAIAALVLGIVSLGFSFFSGFGFPGIIAMLCGIAAIVFGALGIKMNPDKKGMAIAGLVMGGVGLLLGLILFAACGCTVCQAACGSEQAAEEIIRWGNSLY